VTLADWLPLLASGAALSVSIAALASQLRAAKHAALLTILGNMLTRFRSAEFQAARSYLENDFQRDFPPTPSGDYPFPSEAREKVRPCTSFYQDFGLLLTEGAIQPAMVSATFGQSARTAWRILGPYVVAERVRRDGEDPSYYAYFEHLVAVVEDWPPPRLMAKLRLRKPRGD